MSAPPLADAELDKAAEQVGLFGRPAAPAFAPAPAPAPSAPAPVVVHQHVAHDQHGLHVVREHRRAARQAAAHQDPPDVHHKRVGDARFEGLTLEGYYRAGTPEAAEWVAGGGADLSCVRCGARIGHVFQTSHGPMGGDCVATLTGDDSTRRLARVLRQRLSGWAENRDLIGFEVGSSAQRGASIVGIYQRDGRDWRYDLWTGDDAPAPFVHALVEQYVEHGAPRHLTYRASFDDSHEGLRRARRAADRAAQQARAEQVREKAKPIARAEALADHYATLARQVAADVAPGWSVWPQAEHDRVDPDAQLYVHTSYPDWPGFQEVRARLERLGLQLGPTVKQGLRRGMIFTVPSVAQLEHHLAQLGPDPVAAVRTARPAPAPEADEPAAPLATIDPLKWLGLLAVQDEHQHRVDVVEQAVARGAAARLEDVVRRLSQVPLAKALLTAEGLRAVARRAYEAAGGAQLGMDAATWSAQQLASQARPERLRGGVADGMRPEDFDADALAEGTRHELEHTDDHDVAQEIAMDHLAERPDYYERLEAVEGDEELDKAAVQAALLHAGPSRPQALHAPIPSGTARCGHTALMPSKTGQGRRWQCLDHQGKIVHTDDHRQMLARMHRTGGAYPLTRGAAERKHVQDLRAQGLIELKANPAHHSYEFSARLTPAGARAHQRNQAAREHANETRQAALFHRST